MREDVTVIMKVQSEHDIADWLYVYLFIESLVWSLKFVE